jgi:hypothetical protein
MEIDDTDDLSILYLDGDETNKIKLLLTAEDDVAHDRTWHELPHEHRLKKKALITRCVSRTARKARSNALGSGSMA